MPSGSSHHRHSGSSFDSGGSSATESSGGYCSGSGASLKSSSTCSDGDSSETHTSSTLWSSCSGDPSGSSVNRSHGQLVESTDNGTLLSRNPRNIFRSTQFLSYSLPLTLNIHIVQSSREGVPATGKKPNNSQLTQSVARNTTVFSLQPLFAISVF